MAPTNHFANLFCISCRLHFAYFRWLRLSAVHSIWSCFLDTKWIFFGNKKVFKCGVIQTHYRTYLKIKQCKELWWSSLPQSIFWRFLHWLYLEEVYCSPLYWCEVMYRSLPLVIFVMNGLNETKWCVIHSRLLRLRCNIWLHWSEVWCGSLDNKVQHCID